MCHQLTIPSDREKESTIVRVFKPTGSDVKSRAFLPHTTHSLEATTSFLEMGVPFPVGALLEHTSLTSSFAFPSTIAQQGL